MARDDFVQSAHSSPLPNVREHTHTYNCHMAVVNWGLQSLGRTQNQAVLTTDRLAGMHCRMCTGDFNFHQTLPAQAYEARFCQNKRKLLRNLPFDQQIQPGDVILIGVPGFLTHSTVAVRVDPGEIYIRGFNNAGSFAEAVELRSQYDPTDRAITSSNYWKDEPDSFWYVAYEDLAQCLGKLVAIESAVDTWIG